MAKSKVYAAFAWALAFAYMGVIYYLSSRESVPLPMWFPNQDKVYHFVEYGLLGFLLAHAAPGLTHKRRFWIAFVLGSLYGLSDEFHQSFVPGRDASVWDWIADSTGVWMGAYIYLRSENVLRTRTRKAQPTIGR